MDRRRHETRDGADRTLAPKRAGEKTRLKRAIGPGLLHLFMVGDILGTSIYALTGKLAEEIGGVVWLACVVAFAAMSYGRTPAFVSAIALAVPEPGGTTALLLLGVFAVVNAALLVPKGDWVGHDHSGTLVWHAIAGRPAASSCSSRGPAATPRTTASRWRCSASVSCSGSRPRSACAGPDPRVLLHAVASPPHRRGPILGRSPCPACSEDGT